MTDTVHVRAPDGTIGTVPKTELEQARRAGATELSSAEVDAERARVERAAKYDAPVTAGAIGAARGLTLGLSDEAASALGGAGTREALEGYKEANPYASGAGEVAGAIAPLVLSGGAAAPEEAAALGLGGAAKAGVRVAGAIPRGVAALGTLAERGAARVVGEGATSLGGRMLQSAARKGVAGAVEGGLYGAGNAISEDALSEHPDLTAEKLLVGIGHGALLGAGAGVVAGAGGELVSDGAKALGRMAVGAKDGETIAETLDRKSGELAWRSAGGTKAMARGADRFAGGSEEVGKIWRAEAPELVGKKSFGELTREDLVEASEAGQKKYVAELDSHLAKLDDAAAAKAAHPRVLDVANDLEGLVTTLEGRAATGPARAKLQNFADDVKRIGGLTDAHGAVVNPEARLTFRQLRDLRVDADKVWAGNSVDPNLMGFKAEFKKARDLLEDRLLKAGDDLAVDSKGYQAAKKGYQAFAILEKAAGSGVAGGARNRLLSLTDNIVGSGGAHAGAVIGSALGPAGAAAGAALGGGVAALANHAMRQRFDFVASDLLGQLAQAGTLRRISAHVDSQLDSGVRGFLRPGGEVTQKAFGGSATKGEARGKQFDEAARELSTLAANPAKLQTRIASVVDPAARVAPVVSTALAAKLAQAVQHLAGTLPAAHHDAADWQQHLIPPRRPSDLDVQAFERRLEAFRDPASVLRDMSRGRVSRDAVETLRTVYPELFKTVQLKIAKGLSLPSQPRLSRQQKTQLSVLFDVPADETFTPDFIADMQANFHRPEAHDESGGQGPQAQAPPRPLNLKNDNFTQAQKAEEAR